MSRHEDENDEPVGYGKPPRHTRFKKGQSGNPKGRPKGAKGFKASMKRELQSTISVKEGGREKVISKAEAAAKRLVTMAMNGDLKALTMLATFDEEADASMEQAAAETRVDEVDRTILGYYARSIVDRLNASPSEEEN
jgi:hypothetical protein